MKNIAAALLKVQRELDPVHKGRKGYGYTYADLPAVINSCLDALNASGIVMLQCPAQTEKQAAAVQTRLIHAESGEEISSIIEVPYGDTAKMSAAQVYGSAITYARRYALVAMLGIVTEDDDGASAGRKTALNTAAHKMALEQATNLNELKDVWAQVVKNGLGNNEELLAIKELRKGELA